VQDFEDACLYEISEGQLLVSTLDFIPPIVENPYHYGQIAAANAISDVFAMGGQPILALSIVCFPSSKLEIEVLGEILDGVNSKIAESGAALGGGHSVDDEEIKIGLSVNGLVKKNNHLLNAGSQSGDSLVLLKALGTGPLSTAIRKNKITEEELNAAVASMSRLNKFSDDIHTKFDLHAATDITGFGLIGHTAEMARAAKAHIEIDLSKIPFLPGAKNYMNKGYCTKGVKRNQKYVKDVIDLKDSTAKDSAEFQIVCDSETSGGLLLALPQNQASDFIDAMKNQGHVEATEIATVHEIATPRVTL
jgi:selenide,water dikinase